MTACLVRPVLLQSDMVDKITPYAKVSLFYDEQLERLGRTAAAEKATTASDDATKKTEGGGTSFNLVAERPDASQVTAYVGTTDGGDARHDQLMVQLFDDDGDEGNDEFLGRCLLPAKAVAAAAEGVGEGSGDLTLSLSDPPNARRRLAQGQVVLRVDPHGAEPDAATLKAMYQHRSAHLDDDVS